MRHLLITGASVGIGRATAVGLAPWFPRMTLVGRSPRRHEPVLAALRELNVDVELVEGDLAALAEVSTAAARVRERSPVDVVIANAGVAGQRGVTADGFEIHFGINYLAHHLLVTQLADVITGRVIIVSSNAHYDSDGVDFSRVQRSTTSFTGFPEYRDSKLANVLDGRELARRLGLTTHIVHPGLVATQIWRRIPRLVRPLATRRMATPREGADSVVWAATAEGLEPGGYYASRILRSPSSAAMDDTAAAELWDRAEEWLVGRRGT